MPHIGPNYDSNNHFANAASYAKSAVLPDATMGLVGVAVANAVESSKNLGPTRRLLGTAAVLGLTLPVAVGVGLVGDAMQAAVLPFGVGMELVAGAVSRNR